MSGPTSPRWRALRSAVFSAAATGLAALGHLAGGGGSPDPAVLVIGALTVGAVTTGVTRRRCGWPVAFGLLLACQLAFHLLFSVDVHAMPGSTPLADGARMLLFHLVAAAVTSFLLARGDAALFGLFGSLRRTVRLVLAALPVDLPPGWTPAFAAATAPRPTGALLARSPRRGPPTS